MRHRVMCFGRLTQVALLGLTLFATAGAQTNVGVVSIDGVTGQLGNTVLQAGSTHTVSIGYDFTPLPEGWWNSYNAFEVYSPDGANWVNLLANLGPLTTALPITVAKYRRYYTSVDNGVTYSSTASGGSAQPGGSTGANSRVAFSLAVLDAVPNRSGFAGGAGGANGIAVLLQFQSLIADAGKTICLDTVNAAGTVAWEWTSGEAVDHPAWDNGLGVDGPRCWTVASCPNCCSEWCMCFGEECGDNVYYAYCDTPSYTLCAHPYCQYVPVEYYMLPPYDNGDYGSVDTQSGLWTWPNPQLAPGTSVDIQFQNNGFSISPFTLHVTATGCDCCIGRVGDANGSGEDEPTVGDVSVLIDHLFISGAWINCLEEADVNQSGGATPYVEDITIGDISALIDYLFITGPETGVLPECL